VKLQHFIQTRFSVKEVSWAWAEFPPEWFESRVALFEAYCLPSAASQSAADFDWLVYCDESTPSHVLSKLRGHERELPTLNVVLTGPDRDPAHLVGERIEEGTDLVVTTRLDSDDALHSRFVEYVQAYAELFLDSRHERLLLNFPRGYKLDVVAGKAYESRIFNSPFPNLFERSGAGGALRTVLAGSHSKLRQEYQCHQDESLPAWVQVLHGGNVINQLWSGEPEVPRETLRDGFALAETGRTRYYSRRPPWQPSSTS
jgi:hypothetical protein